MNYNRSYCNFSILRASNLTKHEKICTFHTKNKNKCVTCDRVFYACDELFKHSRTCGKFMCFQCDVPFLSTKALDYHILTRHRHVERKFQRRLSNVQYVRKSIKIGKNCVLID